MVISNNAPAFVFTVVQRKAVQEVGFSENYKYCPKLVQTTKASLSEQEVGSGVSTAVEK